MTLSTYSLTAAYRSYNIVDSGCVCVRASHTLFTNSTVILMSDEILFEKIKYVKDMHVDK